MGFLDRLFQAEQRSRGPEDDFWYMPLGDYTSSKAGVYVSRETAMRYATVYACVRVLSEDVSSLPIHLYRRLPNGGRERATDHWAYKLLHDQAGPRLTSGQWIETAMYHMTLVGNHYSVIRWNNANEAQQLFPLPPERVTVETTSTGEPVYVYRQEDGKEYRYTWPNMLHIPAMSWDGLVGLSPIAYARETIGLAVAAEEFGERFFSNGTNMGTIFTMPPGTRLTQEQTDKLREDLQNRLGGLGKSHKAAILPEGITPQKVSIPPDQAQFLETRKFQKAEIASIFRVPLHLIQEHEKNTSWGSGIEQMNLEYIQHTLRPWMVRIERMLNSKLLQGADRENYYFEFLFEGMLRGDQQARAEYFTAALQNGWMSRNEVRQIENRNPVEGGDEFMVPMNMSVVGEPPPEEPDEPDEEQKSVCECGHEHRAEPADDYLDNPRLSIQRSYRRVIRDAIARVIRRERKMVLDGATKHLRRNPARGEKRTTDSFAAFIDEFYKDHVTFTRELITPAFTSLAEAIGAEAMREIGRRWEWNEELEEWLEGYITRYAENHANRSRGQLLALLDELTADLDDMLDADVIVNGLTQRFDEWEVGTEGGRPRDDKEAAGESVRLGEGFARAAFFAAGVTALVWRATGSETCPYCQSLNNRSVGPNEFFLLAGADFQPAGAESPLRPSTNIGHPPAHAGCDCLIVPKGF